MLHILNGDSVGGTICQSRVPGTFSVWADILHEGPVPASVATEEFRETRCRFFASQWWADGYESLIDDCRKKDDTLASFALHDEVVLWFEHDLFAQLILIYLLDYFSHHELGETRLSLVCIGEFPGIDPFHGLGELRAEQLESLFPSRKSITQQQLELGRTAWRAFTSPDPTKLNQLANEDTPELPFLAGALRRFLEEYPSISNGLGRTEKQILSLLSAGAKSPAKLFVATYPLEERIFMGDTTFWTRVKGLGSGTHPLVQLEVVEQPQRLPRGEVRITDTGREVLAGRADWVKLNGIDRWFGGVHLTGNEAEWRWDDTSCKLIRANGMS